MQLPSDLTGRKFRMSDDRAIDEEVRRVQSTNEVVRWRRSVACCASQIAVSDQLFLLIHRHNAMYLALFHSFRRPCTDVGIPKRTVVVRIRVVGVVRAVWEYIDWIDSSIHKRGDEALFLPGVERRQSVGVRGKSQ